jgi:CHASE2 domain-containing sensor protein
MNIYDLAILLALCAAASVAVLISSTTHTYARMVAIVIMAGTGAFLLRASYHVSMYGVWSPVYMGLGIAFAVGAVLGYHVWFWRRT